ncbi:MAG: hypothetical protein IKE95_03525 [Methanobrevibacter sp.]|nr:hypothetical protein [Methanobrevibacter sp.]
MVFTNQDFIDLMNFCRDLDNFHETAKKPFDSICNISKSEGKHERPLIEDGRYWCFNLDNICFNAHIMDNGHKKNHPASTDGLHYVMRNSKLILYFFEFKGLPINSIDYKSKLDSIINSLRFGHCSQPKMNCPLSEEIFKSLTNVKNRFGDEIICQLKIKTIESLFFTLPAIYKYYCEKKGIDYEKHLNEFFSWLLKTKKNFIVIFDDKTELSPSNRHFTFDNRLRDNFNHFKNVANIAPSVVEKSLFEKTYLREYFDRMDSPAYDGGDCLDYSNRYS